MRKSFVLILCLYTGCLRAKFYRKLANKKIASDSEYHQKPNLFQCDNYCKTKHGCKVFNYNMKLQICQLTDRDANQNYNDAVSSDGWEVYIPIMYQVNTYNYWYEKYLQEYKQTCVEFSVIDPVLIKYINVWCAKNIFQLIIKEIKKKQTETALQRRL